MPHFGVSIPVNDTGEMYNSSVDSFQGVPSRLRIKMATFRMTERFEKIILFATWSPVCVMQNIIQISTALLVSKPTVRTPIVKTQNQLLLSTELFFRREPANNVLNIQYEGIYNASQLGGVVVFAVIFRITVPKTAVSILNHTC